MKRIKKILDGLLKKLGNKSQAAKRSLQNLLKCKCFKNRRRNIIVLVVVIFLLLAILLSRFVLVAALVNGWPVSRLSIVQGLEKKYGAEALDNLVSRNLVYQEAKNLKVVISQSDIDQEIKAIENALGKQNVTLDQALTSQGLTKDELVEQIKFQKTVEEILTPKITISDEEIKTYFTENKDYFDKKATVETVKAQIEEQLFQEKLTTVYQAWIAELKAKAKINYFVKY